MTGEDDEKINFDAEYMQNNKKMKFNVLKLVPDRKH